MCTTAKSVHIFGLAPKAVVSPCTCLCDAAVLKTRSSNENDLVINMDLELMLGVTL